ncbi:MAG: VCBS repeat-containing protein [Leadbetterella sp.]
MRFLLFLSLVFLFTSCHDYQLFTKLEPSETGINFANRITENDSMNILKFEYVYNGSGVGVADYNNDGLQDLFFSGNQVENKLFINKGNFKFVDVSLQANVSKSEKWCAGVTTVDINNDGLMDIYVSATARSTPSARENILYVNQGLDKGVPTFKNLATEYGVNDDGHSENATFFDYDNDGDLDLYVLTNVIDLYPNTFRNKIIDGSSANTDRLYRCDYNAKLGHNYYTNVSKQAGITIEGYGLGVNILDVNKDGWKDIYVTNDYLSDDLLYINNQDGTFTDKAKLFFKHTSNSAMGNDVADINNDGFLDIATMDMLPKNNLRKKVLSGSLNYQLYNFTEDYGYNYQYMRNTIQLNNGVSAAYSPMFSEVSLMMDAAETDWSWTPSLADFDNDGYKDMIITNGFPKDVTDRDFVAFRAESERIAGQEYVLSQIPEVKINNYAFRNTGKLGFEDVSKKWGFQHASFSNGGVYADLDNDGDLDYVINNINDSAFVYKNNIDPSDDKKGVGFLKIKFVGVGNNINGIGAVVEGEFSDGEKFIMENNPHRGYLSSVDPIMHIGLGNKKIKSLHVFWQNGKSQIILNPKLNGLITVNVKDAQKELNRYAIDPGNVFRNINDSLGIDFVHQEKDFIDFNIQNLQAFKMSELGPGMAVADVNNDGLDDVFIGGSVGVPSYILIQDKSQGFGKKEIQDLKIANRSDPLGALFLDADLDGDKDLLVSYGGNEFPVGSNAYKDVFYFNDGKGNFEARFELPTTTSTSCIRAFDYDNDRDLDLIVLGRNIAGQYPSPVSSHIYRNDSKVGIPKFTELTDKVCPALSSIGNSCDVLCTDYDKDGWVDMLLASEWSDIKVFKNNKGVFKSQTDTGLELFKGLWTSLNGGDFDHDGDIDYIAGNIGQNTLIKGTEQYPVKILAGDFDKNSVYDAIPFIYFNDENNEKKLFPYNGKEDVNKQLNSTRKRFTSYKEFAKADYNNLLTEDERKQAKEFVLNYTSSIYIENLGGSKFKITELPRLAQISQIHGILVGDYNQDGHLDALISGNNYGAEISTGRYDASNGLFLIGNGKGQFVEDRFSGYYAPHNAKAMVQLTDASGNGLIFTAQNRNKLLCHKTNLKGVKVSSKDRFVRYECNKKLVTLEVYFGSGYLSQSSEKIFIPSKSRILK